MNQALIVLSLLAAGVVLVRCTCVAANLNARDWTGRPYQFIGVAAAYALIGSGALGTALGWEHAHHMLLVGIALWMSSDRRRCPC